MIAPQPPLLSSGKAGENVQRPKVLVTILSLLLVLFLADGIVCLMDDSLIVFAGNYALTGIRGVVASLTLLLAAVSYLASGCTPLIPKRLFLPLALYHPVAGLFAIPLVIFFFERTQQIVWAISCFQLLLALFLIHQAGPGFRLRWPIVRAETLGAAPFTLRNFLSFLLVNLFLVLPGVGIYLLFCLGLAAHHFSDGFVKLRPKGLVLQSRKYVREDGKSILLFPMSHIAAPGFYQTAMASFPTNAVILSEGVSDRSGLLTNKITYERAAKSLGVSEQHEVFIPRGKMIRADIDISEMSETTIGFLNLAMLFHGKGMDSKTLSEVMHYPESNLALVFEDLVRRRNRRVIEEIFVQLREGDKPIVVPWGAAHMPQIAIEIQQANFKLSETRNHLAIPFKAGRKGLRKESERQH
jgi:hypothetical protein